MTRWTIAFSAAAAAVGALAGSAAAEVKSAEGNATQVPVQERATTPSTTYELVCWQGGKEVIRERRLRSIATPGGPGALITYVAEDGASGYVIVGNETTCISKAEKRGP